MDLEDNTGIKWTAVVITSQNKHSADAYQYELELRQRKGLIHKDTLILAVEDPKFKVGSGGATLNALLIVAEYLGARRGYTVVTSEVLIGENILILHMGRQFPFDPCGRAFVTVPMSYHGNRDAETLVCNVDLILYQMTHKIATNTNPGVWVCSTDMFVEVPTAIDASVFRGEEVCIMGLPVDIDYATHHGVAKINEEGYCQDLVFRESKDVLKKLSIPGMTDEVCLVMGLMYFSVEMASRLLSFYNKPPLDSCTYMGLDSGASPIELSIFFDFMLAMCEEITEEAFVFGERSGRYGTKEKINESRASDMSNARALIYRELRGTKVKIVLMKDAHHSYMSSNANTHHSVLLNNQMSRIPDSPFQWNRTAFAFVEGSKLDTDSVAVNSIVEEGCQVPSGCVIAHSHITPGINISKNSIVLGIIPDDYRSRHVTPCRLAEDLILQAYYITLPEKVTHRVLTIFGRHDDVKTSFDQGGTFCNTPWSDFLEQRCLKAEDIWPSDVPPSKRCLLNARLFPIAHLTQPVTVQDILWFQNTSDNGTLNRWFSSWRLSLEDILSMVDTSRVFEARRELFFTVAQRHIRSTLLGMRANRLISLYQAACMDGLHHRILQSLDNVAMECKNTGIAARTLANIADVLGCMADGQGGMRSGPAANQSWSRAFRLLENEDIVAGVQALAEERSQWLDRSSSLVRAARHYEGAASILIRRAVMTARQFVKTEPVGKMPGFDEWIVVECPARADLSGGWSDTPPITYEHGGAVCNVALRIDGQKPIGVKAIRTREPRIVLRMLGEGRLSKELVLSNLSQFYDYCQPHAPGSLLKAAICCAEIVEYPSNKSLEDQLMERFGGGFILHSWSNLPHGSGLGTSSILAGAVIAALWKITGQKFSLENLNHAVVYLEQLLTTGGGWQDQVGGLYGGFKVGHSAAKLPLCIEMDPIEVPARTAKVLEERLILVYTGTTRLAKNLLQNVVRNWYARDPEIQQTEDSLVEGAWRMADALRAGDLPAVGACMDEYWRLKKKMAPGCEPTSVSQMIQAFRPYMHGLTMAGAGGGGFMYVLTKEPNQADFFKAIIDKLKADDVLGSEQVTVHTCSVDHDGISIRIEKSTSDTHT